MGWFGQTAFHRFVRRLNRLNPTAKHAWSGQNITPYLMSQKRHPAYKRENEWLCKNRGWYLRTSKFFQTFLNRSINITETFRKLFCRREPQNPSNNSQGDSGFENINTVQLSMKPFCCLCSRTRSVSNWVTQNKTGPVEQRTSLSQRKRYTPCTLSGNGHSELANVSNSSFSRCSCTGNCFPSSTRWGARPVCLFGWNSSRTARHRIFPPSHRKIASANKSC